jgi:hypothetical protein
MKSPKAKKLKRIKRFRGEPKFKGGEFVLLPGSGIAKGIDFPCVILNVLNSFDYNIMWLCDTPLWQSGETDVGSIDHIDKVGKLMQ